MTPQGRDPISARAEGRRFAETQQLGAKLAHVGPSLPAQVAALGTPGPPTFGRADADRRQSPCASHEYL